MKLRTISTAVALVILGVVLFFYDTLAFNIAFTIVILIAVFELMRATKTLPYFGFTAAALGISLSLPFLTHPVLGKWAAVVAVFSLLVFFIFVLKYHQRLPFSRMLSALFSMLYPSLFFSTGIYMRDIYGKDLGFYLLILSMGSAWFADTGAYLAGAFFGKHQLAPIISPKKTIEGAVGGVVTATVLNVLVAMFYSWSMSRAKVPVILDLNYLLIGLVSPALAGIGIVGDLTASVIKRQYKIKDYGNIMPGHGGVMDRFDSLVLILPAVYMLAKTVIV